MISVIAYHMKHPDISLEEKNMQSCHFIMMEIQSLKETN